LCRASKIACPSDKGAVLLMGSLVSMWTLSRQIQHGPVLAGDGRGALDRQFFRMVDGVMREEEKIHLIQALRLHRRVRVLVEKGIDQDQSAACSDDLGGGCAEEFGC
jgi:hypothetical protein